MENTHCYLRMPLFVTSDRKTSVQHCFGAARPRRLEAACGGCAAPLFCAGLRVYLGNFLTKVVKDCVKGLHADAGAPAQSPAAANAPHARRVPHSPTPCVYGFCRCLCVCVYVCAPLCWTPTHTHAVPVEGVFE